MDHASLNRVMVVDDHPVFRTGLRAVIEGSGRFCVVAEAGCAAEALSGLGSSPDVIVLDQELSGASGLDLLAELRDSAPASLVVLMADQPDADAHRRAIRLGVRGIVLKRQPADVLLRALDSVSRGEVWLEPSLLVSVLSEAVRAAPPEPAAETFTTGRLTPRERQVVSLILEGRRNKEIAARLQITETTVRHHLSAIFAKMGVSDRLELAVVALRAGLGAPREPADRG